MQTISFYVEQNRVGLRRAKILNSTCHVPVTRNIVSGYVEMIACNVFVNYDESSINFI